jgi:Resolvase, N terminal domain
MSRAISNQVAELKAAGCARIFREKISGATAERPQLKKLMAKLADCHATAIAKSRIPPKDVSSRIWASMFLCFFGTPSLCNLARRRALSCAKYSLHR